MFLRVAVIFFVFFSSAVWAQDIVGKVQEQYESLKAFQAEFEQILTNAATKEQEQRYGKIYFKKPRLIRWETSRPEAELLIVGQDIVWNYFVEEEIAYKYPVQTVLSSKTMIRFISGQANLKEDFIVENQGLDQELFKLKLIPKNPEPNLVLAYIWVDQESFLLKKVLLVDFFGNGNEVRLKNLEPNPLLEDSLFKFNPPKGVQIQDNTQE
ncbi:outer membrane lipoprotein chaperone LolA [Desulfohalobiaceae bacterium Ax17]|uniref:outer membrane lipoprotein chaperone LolA n=1 Tax=Desulfovulcanus ferrireducens TaxID=2831190 RepID=UPI00207BB9D9|nr:outer membrane lipoprotein chaperone LolA [Desulfovulcanus ferrireducens]MBT8763314.1 outer membrane lipoprotein chaperone LolA [Desulfovulcanus ferrireducens]